MKILKEMKLREEYLDYTRQELIDRIMELEKQLERRQNREHKQKQNNQDQGYCGA